MLPEVRMARVIDAIGLHQAKKLSCVEAAELLGMSERHFRRLRDAYEERGAEGIVDRRRGRASGRRAPVDEVAWVVEEFRTRYFDFTAKHFHEAIQGRPMAEGQPFGRSYTWTKSVLQQRGLVTKAPKRSAFGPFFGALDDILCVQDERVVMSPGWGTKTRSVPRVVCCKPPSSATAATSSRRPCAFTNTPMAGLRSSTVRAGLPITRRTEP